MASQGDSLIRKTQKGLSILAFETTKQSRILKKRMRITALQKEIKADLRDLGNLVYNSVVNNQPGILDEEEVKILVQNVRENKVEVEHLRDAIARLARTRKHFEETEEPADDAPPPRFDEPEGAVVAPPRPSARAKTDAAVSTEREMKAAILEPALEVPTAAPEERKKPKKAAENTVPPAPGTDPGHPDTPAEEEPRA